VYLTTSFNYTGYTAPNSSAIVYDEFERTRKDVGMTTIFQELIHTYFIKQRFSNFISYKLLE